MSIERDSTIQRIFNVARRAVQQQAFVAGVMSRINSLRRRAIIGWACIGLILTVCAWLLTPAVTQAVQLLTQVLPQSLIEFDDPDTTFGRLLSPLNSIAILVAIVLLGLRKAYKKIF